MQRDGGTTPDGFPEADLSAEQRHVQRLDSLLRSAASIDEVACTALTHLVALRGVRRVGLALSEGAGRRLRFVASDSVDAAVLSWCHIDAYDDVPLTAVCRTGEDVLGNLDELESRFPGVAAREREVGTLALGATPLPAVGTALGGLIVYFDAQQPFDAPQRRLLHSAARRTADALRRVSTVTGASSASMLDRPSDEDVVQTGRHARIELEGNPRSAGAVRRFLREQLGSWGVHGDSIESAELLASELVNNVIMHARSAFRLDAHLEEGVLTVTVRDAGAGAPGPDVAHEPVTDEDKMRVFGRGLTLVDAIADRWGSDRDASGTVAWFAFEIADGSRSPARTG